MTEEIYITIGSRSDKFAKRNVGQTTRWPIKEGAPKGARVYFLIGTELVAKGVIATATPGTGIAGTWGGAFWGDMAACGQRKWAGMGRVRRSGENSSLATSK